MAIIGKATGAVEENCPRPSTAHRIEASWLTGPVNRADRAHNGHAVENLAILRRYALNFLNHGPNPRGLRRILPIPL